ncbi:MAG: hypothetical protein OEQ47_06320 [Acidimicrobiia bacterium]|nr:hypothetical protein [Acidimicrobiia bacterium]
MRLIRIIDALAPNAARGRHEASWRPLPPSRRVVHIAGPKVSSQFASALGVVMALTLVGTTVAVAKPGEPEPGFVVSTPLVVAEPAEPISIAADIQFALPDPTVSTFVTPSTMADLSFELERRYTTTTTSTPPSAEELLALEQAAETMARRVQSMTAMGFEEDVVTIVEEFPSERPEPATGAECKERAREIDLTPNGRWDRNAIARMTWSLFDCVLTVKGLDEVAPSRVRGFDGAAVGFESLAEQMAAEAVVVSYCESIGYQHRALTGSNGFGYAGLFQMGQTEMSRFGAGGSRHDPVDNAYGAVNYLWYQYANRNGWGGWSPWAVVNTNFDDEVNDRVKVPVLPRFRSTDPEHSGLRGPQLPAWAVDPWLNDVPAWNGCPTTGGRW